MADLGFEDAEGFYYIVDVKTHRLSTEFNMPNLTSVDRLARFHEDDANYSVVLMVPYDIEELRSRGSCDNTLRHCLNASIGFSRSPLLVCSS